MLPRSAREVGTGLLYGFQVVLLGHLFFAYGYDAGFAYGVSMTPTIASSGELLITSKKYRRGRGVQVGDIVSFKHPVMNESMQRAAKRVVGMPGDFVLRDKPGAGSYGEEAMLQVPEGHCYVAGDNLLSSRDSRIFGAIPLALIRGKVVAGVKWPSYSTFPIFQRYQNGLQEVE